MGMMTSTGLTEALEAWRDALEAHGRSERTIGAYRADLEIVRTTCEALGLGTTPAAIAEMPRRELDRFCSRWKEARASGQTVRRRVASLRGFARFCAQAYGVDATGLLTARVTGCVREDLPPAAVDEVEAIVSPISLDDDWTDLRDRAFCALQASTAIQPGEILALDR
jgi:site-specific recombinase XerC